MKSAKLWVYDELNPQEGLWNMTVSYESDHTQEQLHDFLREVQKDAVLEGLKYAMLNKDFLDCCKQLDAEADKVIGESIVPLEDVVEITFNKFLQEGKIKL